MSRRQLLIDIIEWDVHSWTHALSFWDRFLPDLRRARVLDLGARHGGLSLHFALKGAQVVCSDVRGPTDKARELHRGYAVSPRVSYATIDAVDIDFPENSFDIVCFKSILGWIGSAGGYARQARAVREMHRILKPQGLLLFAENLTASRLHAFLRSRYVSWGQRWRYLRPEEIEQLLSIFSEVRLGYRGFLAAFGPTEGLRTALYLVDVVLDPLIGRRQKYIVFGCARK